MSRSSWGAVVRTRRAAPGRPRQNRRLALVVTCLLGLSGVVFGLDRLWVGGVELPREYAALTRSGVPVSLTVRRCTTGMHGDRSFECQVTAVGTGVSRTWVYPHDVRQFRPYLPGTSVAALSDPAHPTTVYTVRDVQDAVGAGWTAPATELGAVIALAGCLLAAAGYRFLGDRRSTGVNG